MIDVKEAIAVLKQFKEESQKHKDSYTPIGSNLSPVLKIMQDTYQENIDAFEMAIKSLERTRWIPVSERLPDGDVASVMIYTESGGVAEGQYYPTIKAWKQFRWSVENANVTHWMPLHNPPEVE
jgi:hypothetical protein